MKRNDVLRGLLAVGLGLLLCHCTQDAYEKGEGKYSLMQAELVEAHVDEHRFIDRVLTDEGLLLQAQPRFTTKWVTTPDTTYRMLLYYNKVDSFVHAISATRVATTAIRPVVAFSDGLFTDPVRFESAWLSTHRRFLNAGIYLMTGAVDDSIGAHVLGIIGDTIMAHDDSTRTYHVRLYHDQRGIPQYYSQRTYLSIPLSGLDVDSIRLSINTYEGPVSKTFAIKPSAAP